MTAVQPPLGLQTAAVNHHAELFRQAMRGMVKEGIASPTDMAISISGSNVQVAAGSCFVLGDDVGFQGMYCVHNDGTVSLDASALGDGTYFVRARVRDDDDGGIAGNDWLLELAASVGNSAYQLATIAVTGGSPSLTSDDRRVGGPANLRRVAVRATRATNGTVGSGGSVTPVTFDGTDTYDTDGFHDVAGVPRRLTVPAGLAGLYTLKCQVSWAPNATGYRVVIIVKNGDTVNGIIAEDSHAPASGSNSVISCTADDSAADGDFYEVFVYQTSGVALTLANLGTWFSMSRVSD